MDWDLTTALTFDCYGTLIDWETGLLAMLRPILAARGIEMEDESLLERYGAAEADVESEPYRPYRDVLRESVHRIGVGWGIDLTSGEIDRAPESVGDWPVFPDTVDALRTLSRRYRLAVLSNIDDDLFEASAKRLGVAFDWVVTAEHVRSYKPSPAHFHEFLDRSEIPTDRIVHVAQSLHHDIVPAKALGWRTVWVNRRAGKEGFGATPAARVEPDLMVPDLATLARMAGV